MYSTSGFQSGTRPGSHRRCTAIEDAELQIRERDLERFGRLFLPAPDIGMILGEMLFRPDSVEVGEVRPEDDAPLDSGPARQREEPHTGADISIVKESQAGAFWDDRSSAPAA